MIDIFDFFLLGGTFGLGFYIFNTVMKFIERAFKLWVAKHICNKSIVRLIGTLQELQTELKRFAPAEKAEKKTVKKK